MEILRFIGHFISCGGSTRTNDLWVMSPTSYHCSTPRYRTAKIIQYARISKFFIEILLMCINLLIVSGKSGIRTLGARKSTTVFETAPIDHSGNFPVSRCKSIHFLDNIYNLKPNLMSAK